MFNVSRPLYVLARILCQFLDVVAGLFAYALETTVRFDFNCCAIVILNWNAFLHLPTYICTVDCSTVLVVGKETDQNL